jgi:hypothetical protein
MAKKLPDMQQAGLGDITNILHNQGPISDYSWLAIDEKDYRDAEALPKQNLDTIPELVAALSQEGDERVPSLVPLKPYTIVNSNPLERNTPSFRPTALTAIRDRVAAYVMSGYAPKQIQANLQNEFDIKAVTAAQPVIDELLNERGLLGNVYINSENFARCAQGGKIQQFINKTAKNATFVIAKEACSGCVHNKQNKCGVFKKYLVSSVPYNKKVFNYYATRLASEYRIDPQYLTDVDRGHEEVRKILQASFLNKPKVHETLPNTIQHHPIPVKPAISEEEYLSYWTRNAIASNADKMPGPIYLLIAKKMMNGQVDSRSISASSDLEVRKLSKEYGIIGHTYIDIDALGGCGAALSFVNQRKLSPNYFLSRSASNDKDAYSELSKIAPVVNHIIPIGKEAFVAACKRAVYEKRLAASQFESIISNLPQDADWRKLTAQANLFKPIISQKRVQVSLAPKASIHYGDPGRETDAVHVNSDEVRLSISRIMNSGLYGKALQMEVLRKYSRDDLKKVPEVGRQLVSNDGVQGVFFIDPSVYSDYGKGCITGSKQFRKRGAPYLLVASSCTGCFHQTAPSWCSRYSKRMIRQIPDEVREQAIELRKASMDTQYAPIENPVEKYELSSELPIDLGGVKSTNLDISIASRKITE